MVVTCSRSRDTALATGSHHGDNQIIARLRARIMWRICLLIRVDYQCRAREDAGSEGATIEVAENLRSVYIDLVV